MAGLCSRLPGAKAILHIAIDAHSVGAQLGGNETYAVNLIEALAEIDHLNQYTLYVTKKSAVERFKHRWPNFKVRQTLPHTPLVRIPLSLSLELRRRPVDLLHVQYTAPPSTPCPVVATIHDLAFEHLPETFNRRSWIQLRLTVRRTARHAARIITGSEYSRRDICEKYRIEPVRIAVTPPAAPPHFAPVTSETELIKIRQRYGITSDYILSLSAIQPRKNLVRLIGAYSLLRRLRPQGKLPKLVLAGKRGWLDSEVFRAAEQSEFGKDILFIGYVPEPDLPALFSGAVGFVYPSFFEGFGLPVLEAMQCGVPVIAGNCTSIPEVAGDGALLVDPFNTEALGYALERLIDDAQLRRSLRQRGLKRANEFNWTTTAKLTLQAYRAAVTVATTASGQSH
jgi:glycosyltransferase involved in cell wall biosynthesis